MGSKEDGPHVCSSAFLFLFCLESDGWSGKENPEVTKWWGESASGEGEVPGHGIIES